MTSTRSIQYFTRAEINLQSWDHCIENASNGLIYSTSFYLDHMAGNWDALVLNDYEAVMPLPWRKKWSISYVYQPFLTAQLGLFGNDISAELLQAFLDAIPGKFKLWEFPLNRSNVFHLQTYPLRERKNFVLPLQHPYDVLADGYRENITRNIKKSRQYGCYHQTGVDISEVIALAAAREPGHDADFQNFKKLFLYLSAYNRAKTYGIYSRNNELLASAVFFFSHKRAYYILVGNHPNGRTLGASHALIDAFIKDHADQDLLLDFEGSDIHNLAFFYSSFGAKEEIYPAIEKNRLPWYIKLFRK